MIARTLAFGTSGKLTVHNEQLIWDGENEVHRTFPVEDLGFVVIESEHIVVSAYALHKLAASNVALVICDGRHLPVAQMLPYEGHSTTGETTAAQIAASDAVQGRLWRQLARQKIRNQAGLMQRLGVDGWRRLNALADEVKNGDPANCEGQAARIYFQALMPKGVNRDPDGEWPNAPLNYGYAILRAAVARAIVGSGLLCVRGIHHCNRYNAYGLADDVMEPYRPFVDQYVLGKVRPFDVPLRELTQPMRARLLEMLTCDVRIGDTRRPLMIAITHTTASLARYYLGKDKDGFIMHQFSVYIRHCASNEAAMVHINRVKMLVPEEGLVTILKVTDKQFGDTIQLVGRKRKPPPPAPVQLEFF